ncbi:hypothetical protein K503DRAFT_603232 [Rhizopogon vinicolor AM-OR11-026]|uniref:Uncharacterized protein n=1 Tax=Rhizopogon vinicolor AM-OR11-026 TaxID=1314800 RepID=A0A1B7MIR0_9AGAM|nr:hypothetical protein K503DRAFT_603232 [Rhizopogon vinicolor AM-OR11-026]
MIKVSSMENEKAGSVTRREGRGDSRDREMESLVGDGGSESNSRSFSDGCGVEGVRRWCRLRRKMSELEGCASPFRIVDHDRNGLPGSTIVCIICIQLPTSLYKLTVDVKFVRCTQVNS